MGGLGEYADQRCAHRRRFGYRQGAIYPAPSHLSDEHGAPMTSAQSQSLPANSSGFTLIELMIAMTVFLVIGGAAMSLFRSHAELYTTQQGEVGLNMSLRNALSQIQTDAVQAGNGFYIGGATSTANTPVGITIANNPGSFDSFNILQAATPAVLLGGAACATTTTGTATLAATTGITAANFASGEIMFMNGNGNQMTVAKLSGDRKST